MSPGRTKGPGPLVRTGQILGVVSAAAAMGLLAHFQWANPYVPSGGTPGTAVVMGIQALLALAAAGAALARRPGVLAGVALLALVPVGIYLLGTPGIYAGAGAAPLGYLAAALCLGLGARRPSSAAVVTLAGLLLAAGGARAAPAQPGPAPAGEPPARAIAVTVDDLPGVIYPATLERLEEINRRILAALSAERVPAIGFVTEERLQVDGERDARAAILRTWLDAGLDLGNHGYSHLDLNRIPVADYEDDIIRGEVVTRALLAKHGRRPAYYRHPFTHTGKTIAARLAVDGFLEQRGYRTAPFTIENVDYAFAALHDDALTRDEGAAADRAVQAYITHHRTMTAWAEELARDSFGRDIPQILLIHANAVNAKALPEILRWHRERGYRFVPLDEALADPAYATPDRYADEQGLSWLHRWSIALELPMRLREEPDLPRWVLDRFREIQARRRAEDAGGLVGGR